MHCKPHVVYPSAGSTITGTLIEISWHEAVKLPSGSLLEGNNDPASISSAFCKYL